MEFIEAIDDAVRYYRWVSVDVARSYKDKSGDWQSTTSFAHGDLLNVAECAERAEIWIGRQTNDQQSKGA